MRNIVLTFAIILSCGVAHGQDGLTGAPLLPSRENRRVAPKPSKTTKELRTKASNNSKTSSKSGTRLSILGHLKDSRGEKIGRKDLVRIEEASAEEVAFSKAVKDLEDRLEKGQALVLKERSKHVLALQTLLEKLGLLTKKNASYDWRTRSALRWFQRRNGLPITGRLDSKTLDSIKTKAGFKDIVELKSEPIDPAKSKPIPAATSSKTPPTATTSTAPATSPAPSPSRPSASQPTPASPPVASAPAPTPSTNRPTQKGKALAAAAARVASRRNTVGRCYAGVAEAVDIAIGRFLWGMSAYMAADQLAKHPKFKEITVSASALRTLPPGAIVVWRKTGRSPHGHISVALGDGREASDHIARQMTSLRGDTGVRVFIVK